MKYSRQREAVKAMVMKHRDHPTADAVYAELRKTDPNISLATVYRNLNLLASMGEIRKLTFPSGADHFDGDLSQHYHFICQECGQVYDVPMRAVSHLDKEAERYVPGTVTNHNLVFYGICETCRARQESGTDKKEQRESARKQA